MSLLPRRGCLWRLRSQLLLRRCPPLWHGPPWHQPSVLAAMMRTLRTKNPLPCRGIPGRQSNRVVLLQLPEPLVPPLLLRPLPPATTTGTAASSLLRRATRGIRGVRGHLQPRRLRFARPRRHPAAQRATRSLMTTRSRRLQRVTLGLLSREIPGHPSQRDRRRRTGDRVRPQHPPLRLATRGQRCRRRGRLQPHRQHRAHLRCHLAGRRAMRSRTKTKSQRLQRVTPGLLSHVIPGHPSQHGRQLRAGERVRLWHPSRRLRRRLATRGRHCCRRGSRQPHRQHHALLLRSPADRGAMKIRMTTRNQRLLRVTRGLLRLRDRQRHEAEHVRLRHPPWKR